MAATESRPGVRGWTGLRGWTRDPLLATATVLFVVAVTFAAWSGWSWFNAARAGVPAYSQLRDQVLQAGEQAVQNFNSLDYHNVAAGLNLWEQSSTGPLHAEIASGHAQFEMQIRQAKTVTTAKILDGALTTLNSQAGAATIIVAVQITVTPLQGAPAVKQTRLEGQLTRTPAGWKLSALGPAPVAAAAGSNGKTPSG
jgi:Mce-associated membrane protein